MCLISHVVVFAAALTLKPGVTYLDEPLIFDAAASGTELVGAADGSSVLSGAVLVEGLRFERLPDGVYVADWRSNHVPDQLFINGVQYWMARFPNRNPGEGRNVYDVWRLGDRPQDELDVFKRISRWKTPEGAYLHALHQRLWGDLHWLVKGVSTDGRLELEGGWQNNRPTPPHDVYRYVENVREELDQPGEWFYDSKEKRLYVIPLAGVDLSTARIESVRLRNLLTVRGSSTNPVRNIRIRNVTFRQASRTFMENRERLLRTDWTLCREAAVVFSGAEECVLENCRFENLGGNAVLLDGYNSRVTLDDSSFDNVGASGVLIVGRTSSVRAPLFDYQDKHDYARVDRTPGPRSENYPRDCVVRNCRFRRTGREEKQSAAISIDIAAGIVVRNCTVREVPRAGINIGDGCFGGHLIEGCDVRDTVLETGDHGAFNGWGRDRFWQANLEAMDDLMETDPDLVTADQRAPTVLRGNVWQCAHGWDIDLDDGCSFYVVESNVCLQGGIKLREGFRRTVRGNRCINNGLHAHCWLKSGGDVVEDNDFDRPVSRAGRSTYTWIDFSRNRFQNKARPTEVERRIVDGMTWRKFNSHVEFSAYGVTTDIQGWVLEKGAKAPFENNDLLPSELPRSFKGKVQVYRAQRLVDLAPTP